MPFVPLRGHRSVGNTVPFLYAAVLLVAGAASSDSRIYTYDVNWQFVTVGSISIKIEEARGHYRLSVRSQTSGPISLFRRATAHVVSTVNPMGKRTYELQNSHPDGYEERLIRYQEGQAPRVITFVEMDTELPLLPTAEKDGASVDPGFILSDILRRVEAGHPCDKLYRVYDGKRRYEVQAITETTPPMWVGQLSASISCRVVLDGSSIELAPRRENNREHRSLASLISIWPRAHQINQLEIWIGSDLRQKAYVPQFQLNTRLGKVVARLVEIDEGGVGGSTSVHKVQDVETDGYLASNAAPEGL